MADEIRKIYDVSVIGSDNVISELDKINRKFVDIRKNKTALNLLKDASIEDPSELRRVTQELEKLIIKEQQLKVERTKLTNIQKQASIERQKELKEQRELRSGNQALEGSYNQIAKKYRELSQIAKNTTNLSDPKEVESAIAELKRYKNQLDEFNRGLSKDGNLVGEYTSSIIKAFKQNGLDDVIGGQVTKVKAKVNELDQEFEELKQELSDVGVKGDGAFERIERKMVENRKAAELLENELHRVKTEMTGVGNIGGQISSSISKGFKNVKKDLAGFVLGYLGFQAALQKGQQEISRSLELAEKTEGVRNAFKKLDDPNLLSNLRKATKGTVSDLDLMKASVVSSNFQIPLENLASYFEFAKRRAQDTGESVDYLVNSIVTGIGRKSPLILDNLGISASRLKENLGGVAAQSAEVGDVAQAVGKIIKEENEKVGASTNEVSTRIQENRAQWENFRVEAGEKLLPLMANMSSWLLLIVSALANIPFGVVISGLGLVTTAMALYYAEQLKSYIITQKANKESILSAILTKAEAAQRVILSVATKAQASATKLATYELKLFNGAIKISPLGWFLTILLLIVPAVLKLSKAYGQATGAISKTAKSQQELNHALDIGAKNSAKEVVELDRLYAVATDVKVATDERKKAVDRLQEIYPSYFGNIKDEIILNGQAEAQYYALRDAIVARYQAEALSGVLTKRYEDRAKEQAEDLEKQEAVARRLKKAGITVSKADPNKIQYGPYQGYTITEAKGISDATRELRENDIQVYIALEEKKRKKQKQYRDEDKAILDETQKLQAKAEGLTKGKKGQGSVTPIATSGRSSSASSAGSSSSTAEKPESRIAILKETLEDELQVLETKLNDQLITEEEYLQKTLELYQTYRTQKIAEIKNLNDEELEDSIDFDSELSSSIAGNRERQIQLEKEWNDRLLELSKSVGEQGIEVMRQYYRDQRQEIENQEQAILDKLNLSKASILTDSSASPEAKQSAIAKLEEAAQKEILALRLKTFEESKRLIEEQYQNNLISQEVYLAQTKSLEDQRLEVLEQAQDRELELLRQKEDIRRELIQQAKDLANTAMTELANSEKEQIQELLQFNQQRTQENFDSIKARRLEEATSREEILLIEQEFRREQEKLDRRFAEEKRQAALSQLEIDFALATVKALLLLPNLIAAGAAEATALITYGIARNRIRKQKFEHGGILRTGGLFVGPSHASGGISIYDKEVEGGEGFVINKKSIYDNTNYTITGTPSQIASTVNSINGGIDFAPGGDVLGSSLSAPYFNSYTSTASSSSTGFSMENMEAMVNQLGQLILAESLKPIVLNTSDLRRNNSEHEKRNVATTL